MFMWVTLLLGWSRSCCRPRHELALENLALRQQLAMLKRRSKRACPSRDDRFFWIAFSRYVEGWRQMLVALHPDTVVRWHREGFRRYWARRSRRVLHVNVTAHPTSSWTAQQMIEAFPFEKASGFVLRDRDCTYGESFRRRVADMGINEVLIAQRSPWQNLYVERVVGSVRRECLDHVIILNERHLRRILHRYLDYYHGSRTHLSLVKDAPDSRPVSAGQGTVVPFPKVGGLHHHYERVAA